MKDCKHCGKPSTDGEQPCPWCRRPFSDEEMKRWNDYLAARNSKKKKSK
jgi:RNA polymerase subunit RPABC4/transcription elongation factor Spt4